MKFLVFGNLQTLVPKLVSGNVLHISFEMRAERSLIEWLFCGKYSHVGHWGFLSFNRRPEVHFSVLPSWRRLLVHWAMQLLDFGILMALFWGYL